MLGCRALSGEFVALLCGCCGITLVCGLLGWVWLSIGLVMIM